VKTNQAGIDLIKHWESFRSKPYRCAAGVETIGYGSTYYPDGKKVTLKDKPITERQAQELLRSVLPRYENAVSRLITTHLNGNQFAALVSFAFNLGTGALQRSGLRQKLNRGDYDCVPKELMKWCYAGGRKLNGLVKRRKAEADLFSL